MYIDQGTGVTYLLHAQIRKAFKHISFPAQITDQILAAHGIFPVFEPNHPPTDPLTESIDEFPPAFVEATQRWERQYAVRAATAEEIAERQNAIRKHIIDAAQERLDQFAQEHGYDSILSACTYATSSVPGFAAEGQRAVDLRDQTWAALLGILNDVRDGLRAIPTWAEVEAELPVLAWPN